MILLLAIAGATAGCGRGAPGRDRDGGGAADDGGPAPAIPVTVRALGKGALDEFAWRAGPGQAAFARALAAEKRGDLPAIEREASAALAADPGHLEAAWVAAVARARLGRPDAVVAALEIAAAGDWAKWGERSLELSALADFRATAAGRGWVEAAGPYRAALAAALASAVVVIGRTPSPAGPGGRPAAELYAVAGARWIRLTRTGGAIAGVLRADGAPLIAYAALRPIARARAGAVMPEVRIGVVDLVTGVAAREVVVRDVRELTLSWRSRADGPHLEAAWSPGTGRRQTADVDWRHARRVTIDKPRAPAGERLVIDARTAARRRLPIAGVTADWDDRGTASAMRLDQTGKVVAAPGGALIDGDTVVLAPDGARLAFAIAAEPPCADGDERRLYVAEVATGRVRALARGAVAAAHWLDDDRLAFTDGLAVTIAAAATGKAIATIAGGAGVTTIAVGTPRRCEPAPAPFADVPLPPDDPPEPFDEAWGDPAPPAGEPADEPADAGAGPAVDATAP